MSTQNGSNERPVTKTDEPIGEIAAAIARAPDAPKADAAASKPPVPPIGEIESAIERDSDPKVRQKSP